jgi:hypothetical protein
MHALFEVVVEFCPEESDDERFVLMQAAPTVDRRMAAARMQLDKHIVVAVFVCMEDGDLMTKLFEDARPSQRCYAIVVSGPGRRHGGDEDLHRSLRVREGSPDQRRGRWRARR